MENRVVVIADIVGSRTLRDRDGAQRAIEAAVAEVEAAAPAALMPFAATVGDEFQAVYDSLPAALRSLLLLQLVLPEGIDLRFGVGVGEVDEVASQSSRIWDGPGWWAARAAIDEVHRLQDRAVPRARTRVVGAPGQDAPMTDASDTAPAPVTEIPPVTEIHWANAYLLARDELVGAMSDRARRLTYGRHLGRTQRELADAEGISQPAVSQILSSAGASALLAGLAAIEGGDR